MVLAMTTIILISALSLISLVCVASNFMVCYIIYHVKTATRSFARSCIFSLALTDLLVGGVCVPFYSWLETKWRLMSEEEFEYFAIIYDSVDAAIQFSSIIHLCIMSIDRCIAITKPLHHRRLINRSWLTKLLLIPWTSGLLFVIPYILVERSNLLYFIYFSMFGFLFYLLPIGIITVSYTLIFREVRKRNRLNITSRVNEMKLTRTILAVILTFLICWTPFVCLSGYVLITAFFTGKRPPVHWYYVVIKLISYINSALNPFIYAMFHSEFSQPFKGIIRCCKSKQRRHELQAMEIN